MNLSLLAPEIFLTVAALGVLTAEAFKPGPSRLWVYVSGVVLGFAFFLTWRLPAGQFEVMGMVQIDGMGRFLKLVLILGVGLVLAMSLDYREYAQEKNMQWGTYCGLLLLSTVGLLLMVSSTDLLMILISMELVSITSFILTGYLKHKKRCSEAAIKYFLVGALASGLMIYGISLLYGVTGSTHLDEIVKADLFSHPRLPLVAGFLFVLAGFGFKLALAPFHMWVPDAYEGAPTPITAFLSVAPKAAAVGILVRAMSHHSQLDLSTVLAVLAALTMTVGNLSALKQTNIKRLLGYSSIAQMGYVMVGLVAAKELGVFAVLLYATAYLFMNLGAFACVLIVTNEAGADELDVFAGLSERSLPLALVITLFLLSLTGIPPLIGFVGKFSIFAAAVKEGWIWLAVVGVLNSVVSLYYYFGIVYRMFFNQPTRTAPVVLKPFLAGCVTMTLFVTLILGIFPNPLLAWIRQIVP